MTVALADLAPWPDPDASQGGHDRHRLLAAVAGQLTIVSRPPTRSEWQLAAIPVDALPDLRAAVDTEGRRTDRRQIPIAGRTNWRSVRRHPDRARRQILARIDLHTPGADS
jgi:hypothetical protein